jgi:tripartite-type tricarboxylate transporter receptor subunit TctC
LRVQSISRAASDFHDSRVPDRAYLSHHKGGGTIMALSTQRRSQTRKTFLMLSLLALVFMDPVLSEAQQYPTKPINMMIAVAVGGTVDISGRILAGRAEKVLGQPIVVTNNGGGTGSVAYGILAKEKPDGYHIVLSAHNPLVEVPQLRAVPYKVDDFVPVMQYAEPQSGVVVRTDSPFKTFKDLIEFARKNPGKVTYTVSGSLTPHNLAMMHVAKLEGIQWTGVPVPGGDPNMPLLGGHVTAFAGATAWKRYVDAGQFRLLVTLCETRMPAFPDIPTLKDLGYGFVNLAFYLISVPRATPAPILKKLEDAFRTATEDPEFIAYMKKAEIPIAYRDSEGTKAHLKEAYGRFGKIVGDLKIPTEK